MKFELKTENENYTNRFLHVFRIIFFLTLIFIFCDFALKLRIISRHYQIEYNCKLLSIEKSKSSFKKLSTIFNIKNKQRIWEICREFVR